MSVCLLPFPSPASLPIPCFPVVISNLSFIPLGLKALGFQKKEHKAEIRLSVLPPRIPNPGKTVGSSVSLDLLLQHKSHIHLHTKDLCSFGHRECGGSAYRMSADALPPISWKDGRIFGRRVGSCIPYAEEKMISAPRKVEWGRPPLVIQLTLDEMFPALCLSYLS